MLRDPAIALAPIQDPDVPVVAAFLHERLNARVTPEAWTRAMVGAHRSGDPNHGFLLTSDGTIVGVCLAFYSERVIDGGVERFCNLGAWCVDEEYRAHGLRLLRALLGQRGFTFTDFSPSGNVVKLNERLGFEHLDTTTALVPNLGLGRAAGRVSITEDPETIYSLLDGDVLRIYADHREAAAAIHLVVTVGSESAYVLARKDRRKGLPVFASILFVSRPEVLRRSGGAVFRRLLVRHGALATLLEPRLTQGRPPFSRLLDRPRPKMFKSDTLGSESIDYLYSELTWVAW